MKEQTRTVRTQIDRTQYGEHSTPLFLTSSFVFEDMEQMEDAFLNRIDRNVYSRYSNPNMEELIQKVCAMEKAEAGVATASGMAAVFASMASLLKAGDHVLASRALFGSTYRVLEDILSRWGITHSYAEPESLKDWADKMRPNTKFLYTETPSNPLLKIVDLQALSALAKQNDAIFCVDNCFATPLLQKPLTFGADLSVHSGTKYLDGQGRVLGGLVVGKHDLIQQIQFFNRHTGPSLSPFNAWVLSKSLETLSLRMDRHSRNGLALARFLEQHPQVERVYYPFLESHPQFHLAKKQMEQGGGVLSFELKGCAKTARQMIDRTELFSITSNLGDSRSIITHPASSFLAKMGPDKRKELGVSEQLIRISAGLEAVDDLIQDLEQAIG